MNDITEEVKAVARAERAVAIATAASTAAIESRRAAETNLYEAEDSLHKAVRLHIENAKPKESDAGTDQHPYCR